MTTPARSHIPALLLTTFAALTACSADIAVAPAAITDPPHAFVVSRDLLAAVADAEERIVPTLDESQRPDLTTRLADLRAALEAGQLVRTWRAVGELEMLLATDAARTTDEQTGVATAADLSALSVLVDATRASIAQCAPQNAAH